MGQPCLGLLRSRVGCPPSIASVQQCADDTARCTLPYLFGVDGFASVPCANTFVLSRFVFRQA